VGAILPIENAGFFILSSAAAKAFIMRNLARHEKLQRVFCARIIAEIDQPFINDLRTGFGGDVAAQIDVKLSCDLEVIGGPWIALRVEKIDAAAAGNGDDGFGFRLLTIEFGWLKMEARETANDLQMTEFLRTDVHQEVFRSGSSQFRP
jgi:hypothetical protein